MALIDKAYKVWIEIYLCPTENNEYTAYEHDGTETVVLQMSDYQNSSMGDAPF